MRDVYPDCRQDETAIGQDAHMRQSSRMSLERGVPVGTLLRPAHARDERGSQLAEVGTQDAVWDGRYQAVTGCDLARSDYESTGCQAKSR